ncbi:MAG: hypothetical protein EBS29_05300 [Chloroflexia bacterium]|nr:hypothetical protein [Chloroflexia bacterium]
MHTRIVVLTIVTLLSGACQTSLPNILQPNPNQNYPQPGTPITLANNPNYPSPYATANPAPSYPTPAELPTAITQQSVTPAVNPSPDPVDYAPPLSNGANLQQPGTYTVKLISVSNGNQIIVSNNSSEQMVTLVGIITVDQSQQANCANLAQDRLTLLTANLEARYTLTVIKPDPNDPTAVIGKIVRHDTIDLGLDLVASGLALLNTDPFDGRENYVALEAAAKAEAVGRWQEPCKFSDSLIDTQQA